MRSCLIFDVLKVESTGFTVGMNKECEIMQRVVNESKVFGAIRRIKLLFAESRRTVADKGASFGGRIRSLVLDVLSSRCLHIRYPIEMISKILGIGGSGWRHKFGSNQNQIICSLHCCAQCLLCCTVCELSKNCVCRTLEL